MVALRVVSKQKVGDVYLRSTPVMPNLNSRKDWSELDLQDLRDGLRLRSPMQELADFLMRDVEEVEAKAAEMHGERHGSD